MNTPIPDFDHNLVLPPHKGNPTVPGDLSPYVCTSLDFCRHFATSMQRIEILKNLLHFRQLLRSAGLLNAKQWIDGSFLENIEQLELRAPRDIDILTIYWGYSFDFQKALVAKVPAFGNPVFAKSTFKLDHYHFDAESNPLITIDQSRYWIQLFSHNRKGIWKGILSIDLNLPEEDKQAMAHLQTLLS